MHWVLISGSWRITNNQVDHDVRHAVKQVLSQERGIITGGALGVDYLATQEVIKLDLQLTKLQVFIPAKLTTYLKHYQNRSQEEITTTAQTQKLTHQLQHIKTTNSKSLIELDHTTIDQHAYYHRNSVQVEAADELIAFHVNRSAGVQDVINKAKKKNIPITVHRYQIPD